MNESPTVSLRRCPSYGGDLRAALDALLRPLGGWAAFVRPGQTVLVKPNLLGDWPPEKAVTTHPEVVRAILRSLKELGAHPQVGDSPASAMRLQQVWEKTGYRALCDEEGVPLLNLEQSGSVPVETDGFRFSIARPVLDADVVVSVPKVKTHILTLFTAGVKNMLGVVPGFQKTILHRDCPTPARFGRLLAAIVRRIQPRLTIADGVVGMEGDGPSAGQPVTLGFLAASADAVALDLALCRVLGIRARSVPYLHHLLRTEDVPGRWAGVRTVGENPDGLVARPIRTPRAFWFRLVPPGLARVLGPLVWIRPAFTSACKRCGRCVSACPMSALDLAGADRPVLNPKACIGCCCCHETCPERAVTMGQSPLLRLARGGRMP